MGVKFILKVIRHLYKFNNFSCLHPKSLYSENPSVGSQVKCGGSEGSEVSEVSKSNPGKHETSL